MDESASIEVARQYLRRKYADDLVGLKALADTVAANGAFRAVTITGNGFEGGQAQGQITFPPLAYLAAIEGLIGELDSTAVLPPVAGAIADFSCRVVET